LRLRIYINKLCIWNTECTWNSRCKTTVSLTSNPGVSWDAAGNSGRLGRRGRLCRGRLLLHLPVALPQVKHLKIVNLINIVVKMFAGALGLNDVANCNTQRTLPLYMGATAQWCGTRVHSRLIISATCLSISMEGPSKLLEFCSFMINFKN
jgi:hypothetical protein